MAFRVRSAAGSQSRIGDVEFGNATNHAPRTDEYTGVTLEPGLQEIEILYWDQGGNAVLEIEARPSGGSYEYLNNDDFGLFEPALVDGLAANETIIADPDNAGQYLLVQGLEVSGGPASDTLEGSAYNDILVGGGDNDLLVGDTGADRFRWEDGDQGVAGSPAVDTIADFNRAEGDTLDIADLLDAPSGADLTDYLHFEYDGSDTLVNISTDGNVASNVDQVIRLQGVDLTAIGSGSDQDIINALVSGDNLIT
jgi:hypothetical protein